MCEDRGALGGLRSECDQGALFPNNQYKYYVLEK